MNEYDSVRMADVVAPLGYRPVSSPEGADLVILNTCHIREKAAEKVYSELGRLKTLKSAKEEAGGRMMIAVAGCVAQAEGAEVMARAPYVDMAFGPQTYHRLPEMVAKASRAADIPLVDTEFPVEAKFDFLPENSSCQGVTAFLSVQEGCDKFCTFCVVPYTRGAEYSRTIVEIDAEARRIVDGGSREITLLGQNVNAYHGRGPDGAVWGLGRLIQHLAQIDGLERLRYTTSHPRDMDGELIDAHRDVEKLMPNLHLPVQSGADRILLAMNRRHDADTYLRIVDRLRAARPDIALSSDFIVGYPGETDCEFAETLRLVNKVEFSQAYSFKYSARPGTPAAALEGQVPAAVKQERLVALQQLLRAQQNAFNHATVGTELPVLFERKGRQVGQLTGRSPYLQSIHVEADDSLIGTVAACRIVAAAPNSLEGTLIDPPCSQLSRTGSASDRVRA
jgi:tRNA-2-methylthio-N6-dimethylallyladenosine synthase